MTSVFASESVNVPVLSVQGLHTELRGSNGAYFPAVTDVSFDIMAGETLGVVGESGSGKSITARSIMRLVPKSGRISAGRILLRGKDVLRMSTGSVTKLRGRDIAMVFQDPMSSLNPVTRIGRQLEEMIRLHSTLPKRSVSERVLDLLGRVGIRAPRESARAYPHEFSGGMRQRVMIAMGMANGPALLIADEPTTALDVTLQEQIIGLMRDMNQTSNTAIMLITHNVALVASLCSRVIVLYAGRVVEEASTETLFRSPQHPYTAMLLRSVPRMDEDGSRRLVTIEGHPPDPTALPKGCKFEPRCPYSIPRCETEEPPLEAVASGQKARCWVLMRHVAEGS
jgi:peptide/nickel transport system ATP-binding protein